MLCEWGIRPDVFYQKISRHYRDLMFKWWQWRGQRHEMIAQARRMEAQATRGR